MTGQIEFTMPVEQEEQYENDKSNYTPLVNLYKPLPLKAGERFVNELFIPLFDPATWNIFNRSPEDREILGLVDGNPLAPLNEQESPLYSFYFKVPVHSVQEFIREDGSTGYAQVICPKNFNAYLTKAMGRRPLFKQEKCAFCEASSKGWDDYNARWAQIEQETGIKKSEMSADGRREKGERDPILKEAYARAKGFSAQDKCIMNVFDLGKLKGSRRLDEDNEVLSYQIWFAPKKVFQHLREQWVEDRNEGQLSFFSFYNPQGLQTMKVIKSTERCKGRNLRDTEYNVLKGSVAALEEGWMRYLKALENMVDPSELLHMISYENMLIYTQPEESYNQPATQQVPTAAPPAQAPQTAPQAAPPSAPPQAAPPAAPPMAAPPQAAPPAAPPMAAPPQVAPPAAPPMAAPPQAAPPAAPPMAAPPMAAPPAQMPQAMPPVAQMPAANPPIASGGVNTAGSADAPAAPTAQMPDRTPPTGNPPGSAFSW